MIGLGFGAQLRFPFVCNPLPFFRVRCFLLCTAVVHGMGCCTLQLDEGKSKDAGFAQPNGFGPAFVQKLLRKCNKCDLTVAPFF
jgi:hypothetical protein